MNIDNALEIAKIEAEVDTLCRLSELDLIDKDELDNRLGDAVVRFMDLYDKGGIDSKFCYDMARELSNKIEQADTGDGWWTLNFEDFSRDEKLTSKKVIAESIEKQEKNRIRLERENKAYRVVVRGTETTPVDDMQPLYGTFEGVVEFEIGEGANSISDALKIVKEFDAQNREKNKELMIDEFERDVGYLTPSRFRIFDSAKNAVIGGVWENKTLHIPDDNLNQGMVDMLNKKIEELEKQYEKEFRADNNDTCRRIAVDIDIINIKLLNDNFAKNPPEENVRSEVSKFNYPVVYWGNDDLEHSTSHEGNIYYSLEEAESYYQTVDQQFKGANLDYDVSIYKLTNDKGYLKGCDVVLDDEAFNSLSLIKSSKSVSCKTSSQEDAKPSDNFSVILDGLPTASDAVISEEYEKRYTSLISGVDANSCLILTDSLHFFNQIKGVNPGSSEFDERIAFLASESKSTPVVISGEDYLNWFEKNKDQVIELYKMEDATSYAAEVEAGKSPGTWCLFEDKMIQTVHMGTSLLNDLRAKGTEHTPVDNHTAGNRPRSPA
ncbi:TPA_asm: hypothetical protein G1N77_19565 [Salmonella enterica subsp. enterica serovar Typhimurium]|uniref:Uncharacterized protein n=3 Tax=Salmonella enterica TaxID=28901 RepID=A0A717RTB8_SALTM|nr:hypothetical protein [Salmonella enterica subsp. enterica serovar Nigeria]HAB6905862.1 hypothetical protein [Salmonella enterica subsp. enterica serovar Typhimurium]HAD4006459.1 hypothetical protein [Salmonella enterica]HAD6666539.1 hypothetical protein [Salmonella enterica subsp. enterica serovar Typhimurium str. SL1344]HAE0169926.1 hypothetical protein [Salmonella enterica subsp. enterica serovar Enteritidis str. P125109]HCK9995193.1 hypothetical protein [Salmonella enterica subsp. enteri